MAKVKGMLGFMLTEKQKGQVYTWSWEGSAFPFGENSVHKQGKSRAESWMCYTWQYIISNNINL